MKINRLEINGFGRFENRSFVFSPGINVIYGCNESGKSTLQAFIKAMLFGLKGGRKSKEGFLPPAKQYKPWIARMYGGILEYELDDGRRYSVNRNFDKNTLAIYDEHANNITGEFPAGKDEGARFAEQHLGLSESCFIRTVFIGQLQSVIDSEGKKVLAERMTNIRQSGDEEVSYRKAVKALKDAQLSYVGSERSTTRPLNIISLRLEEAIREEQAAAKLHEDSINIFIELDKAKREETALGKELEALLAARNKLLDIAEIKNLRDTLQTLEEYIDKLKKIDSRKREIKNEMARIETQIEPLQSYKNFSQADIDCMVEDSARFGYIDEDYRRILRQRDELEEKIKEDEDILSEYDIFNKYGAEIDAVLDKILNDEDRQVGAEQDIAEKRNRMKNRLKTRKRISIAGIIFSFLLLLSAVLFSGYYPQNAYLPLLIIGIAVFAGMSALFLFTLKKQKLLRQEDDAKNREYEAIQAERQENRRIVNQWIKEANVETLQDFIRLKGLYEDRNLHLQGLREHKERLGDDEEKILTQRNEVLNRITQRLETAGISIETGVLPEQIQIWKDNLKDYLEIVRSKEELDNDNDLLLGKEESLYREISLVCGEDIKTQEQLGKAVELRKAKLDGREIETQVEEEYDLSQIEERIQKVNEQIRQNGLLITRLSAMLENIPDDESLQKIHESVQELTEEKQKILFLGEAIETAIQVLSEASLAIRRDYVPSLNREIGDILNTITSGKYKQINADDSLQLNILSPESPEWVLPEQLSSGTADQVYLALRLAAVRLVEKNGETMPLFFDEPFVQYDEERTENALRLLLDESRSRQIFLFTCKEREIELLMKQKMNQEVLTHCLHW